MSTQEYGGMNNLTTKLACTEEEWAAVRNILNGCFSKAFQVQVQAASSHVIARTPNDVVATVGIELSTGGRLPLEQYLRIEDTRFCTHQRATAVEFTRWASRSNLAGAVAIVGAAAYAHEIGKHFIVFSMKAKQLCYLNRLRLPFTVLTSQTTGNVPEALKSYYLSETPPQVIIAQTLDVWQTFDRATRTQIAA